MDKNLHNIDQRFQDAFGGYEAPYGAPEMQADWSQVSAQLPQAPLPQAPVKAPVWGAGKVLSIAGAAAVATTAAILIYNAVVNKPAVTEQGTIKPGTEQIAQNQANIEAERPVDLENDELAADGNEKGSRKENNAAYLSNGSTKKKNIPYPPIADGGSPDGALPGGSDKVNQVPADHNPESGVSVNPKQDEPQRNATRVLPFPRDIYFTDTAICAGGEVGVENLSVVTADNKIILEWGDGAWTPFEKSHRHKYANAGKYTVRILHGDEVIKKTISVEKVPAPNFTSRCEGAKCIFRNTSETNLNWSWNFGDGTPARAGYSQQHQYRDTGWYNVTLTGVTPGGCTTTVTRRVYVVPSPEVFTVITPNGDGLNDEMVINIQNESYFELVIYSPDNRVIYKSNDKNDRWKGKDMRGQNCQPGTYYYLLQYKYRGDNELRQVKGPLLLE